MIKNKLLAFGDYSISGKTEDFTLIILGVLCAFAVSLLVSTPRSLRLCGE
jgi:hypothetical protein